MNAPILRVTGLQTDFRLRAGRLRAVNGVSFALRRGEVLGVVGESGCGKTQLAMSIMRLLPRPTGMITAGSVELDGTDLLTLSEAEMREVRGNRISMVFQEPMTALNPVLTVGSQIAEALELHTDLSRTEIQETSVRLLRDVGIPDPEDRLRAYPFQLSGGLRQRVVIAIAMACDPEVLIADEPTTALDVTVQAQILSLFQRIQAERSQSIMFITHDLSVLSAIADRIMVMYAGELAEIGPVRTILDQPAHPYTRGLLASVPAVREPGRPRQRLSPIPGTVTTRMADTAVGCPFADRCPSVMDQCRTVAPPRVELTDGHAVRCHLYTPEAPHG